MINKLPNRKALRLKRYDYSRPGYYFITILTQNRIHRFGKIENGQMILNDAGKMVRSVWFGLPKRFPMAILDSFQIMPNHIHAIIGITALMVTNNNPDSAFSAGAHDTGAHDTGAHDTVSHDTVSHDTVS
ncbi:hypothetical protein QA601_18935, partial [Chitinispirillales bacterium ANBcel5]|nr:hypothetical protein [Chitinispirillales bacterium ANBcel5]